MLSVNGLLLQVDKANVGRIVSRIQMAVTTAVEEVDLKTTCRICLLKQEPSNLFCLFGTNKMFEDLSIASAILDCFGVELKQDEELPNYVCIKCASSTLQSYTFKKCLKKCQGYLEKRKGSAVVKKEQSINSKNKANSLQESHGILFNYLSQKLPSIQEEPNDNASETSNSSISNCNLDHSYNMPLCDENKENVESSAIYAIADHNYSKEIKIEKNEKKYEELDQFESTTETKIKSSEEEYEAQDHFENTDQTDCTNNSEELKEINSDGKVENPTIKILNNAKKQKKLKQTKNSKTTIKTSSLADRWWSKEAGPPYECKICGRAYGVKFRAFYMHARMHRIQKLSCTHCGKKFTRDKMIVHMRTHTNEKPFVCDRCPQRFSIEGNLKRHLRCHTGEKLYVCDICGKAFTQSTSLQNHKQAHAGRTLFVCVYCGKTFSSDSSHRSHLHIHHNKMNSIDLNNENSAQEEDSAEKYTCGTCGKVFRKSVALRIHARVHLDNKKYFCGFCLKRFTSHFNYQIHTTWHELQMEDSSQIKDLSCKFCSEVFNDKSSLVTHVLTHLERPYVCNTCGNSYVTKVALLHHSRLHSDEKPFICSVCGKTFRYTATLKQHFRVHTGEKPHKCDVCSRVFAQQQQLTSHMLTHTGERKYICPYCGKAFALNGNLTVHKRRHTGETPYICNECGKGFYDSSSLKKHKHGLHKNILKNVDVNEMLQKEDIGEFNFLDIQNPEKI